MARSFVVSDQNLEHVGDTAAGGGRAEVPHHPATRPPSGSPPQRRQSGRAWQSDDLLERGNRPARHVDSSDRVHATIITGPGRLERANAGMRRLGRAIGAYPMTRRSRIMKPAGGTTPSARSPTSVWTWACGRPSTATVRIWGEADRRQPVEKFPAAAGDRRRDHQPEFVDEACGQQRLRDRDAGVDADVASGSVLQVSDEVDQPTVDRTRVGPLGVERCGCRDVLRDRVDE